MQLNFQTLFVTFGLFLFSASSAAGVIYDNGTATGDSARCAETSGACSGSWTVFDDFVVGTDSEITSISWTARFYAGLSDYNFSNIWIYDNDPVFASGTQLFSFSSAGTVTASGLGSNFYDIALSGFSQTLAAGTYWLGLQHDTNASYATVASTGAVNNSTQWQNDGAGNRNSGQPEMAFKIHGNAIEVSEPAYFGLFILLSLSLLSTRRHALQRG